MQKYQINPEKVKQDCLIIPVFEDKGFDTWIKNVDQKLNGLLTKVFESKDFEAKKKQSSLLFISDGEISRVLLVGLGKTKDLTVKNYKEMIGSSVLTCQNKKYENLSLYLSQDLLKMCDAKKLAQETVIACEVAMYAYDDFKSKKEDKITKVKSVNFLGDFEKPDLKNLQKGIDEGFIIASGVNFARHLGNIPPTDMTPEHLGSEAIKMAKENKNLKTKVLSQTEIEKLGMGSLLAVGRGSKFEPKFIIVEYFGTDKSKKPSVLVGKGITFDSGGLSIKPGDYMVDMKFDMLGAASVLGTIKALADLQVKKNIIAIVPSAENMPGGDSYRPDDILTSMAGDTIEVKNTDAEGRLVLLEGLRYATKYSPKEVIDLATLTGACMAALGLEKSGLFTPEDKIAEKMLEVGEEVGESLWRLPLGEEYSEAMKSEVADIKNIGGVGGERYGTASTAAAFLQFFTQDRETGEANYPWAHIDLASAIYGSKGKAHIRAGANGFGVQVLVEYLRS
ncbi:MAG: leucyl aminopeptidase [Candidatus Magasanikbacteria bacterium CG_4_10_14_0_2_um_filter_33_14]|uniref:Probable cytosol aminopeptidase n=1 Tax=Candidatus Magasanikbacteria bacterium CG_4_10_14_0_2_um_filter_33_14 TaxID=1974636 RepID=A0A2M7VBH7_9BACT|nr:MAG: leucyl aminopeptidase [Candidatus Magasanikbacteria bacterium CG_4_10_14_0_2_um_filter_33_14]